MCVYRKTIFTTILIATLGLMSLNTAQADICPVHLKRDYRGYWYSNNKPGWRSYRSTIEGVVINTNHFGGVVYSPKRHRIACVYKASNGKWLALISNEYKPIIIDQKAMDYSGHHSRWQFDKKYKDYVCGQPTVKHIKECSFQLVK